MFSVSRSSVESHRKRATNGDIQPTIKILEKYRTRRPLCLYDEDVVLSNV